ncbi:MAG: hypothetical protein ABI609_16570, partial [Acidobacteriota bacterium]
PADTFGGRLLFYAREAPGAVQSLWSTDGLPSHSVRLTALPRNNSEFTFSAVRTARGLVFPGSGPEGVELWRSNGLRAGTRLVTDIDPSILGGSNPTPFAALGDRVFFYAADGVHGEQLWTSRGDADNTERLSSFSGNWSPCDRGGFSPSHAEGSTLEFFAGYDSGTSHLWRTDGTAEGTFALAPYVCAASNGAAVVGDALFFSDQNKLFRSDGSVAGTQQVTALGDGSIEWIDTAPVIGGKLVVKQGSATRTTRFVATDGSVAGSQELLDNRPVACVAALGQKLLWVLGAEGASAANAFATSDISGAAPQEISDLGLAPGEYVAGCRTVLSESRSFWFLDVQGGTSSSHRLWVSDGTAEGTTRLADDVQIGDGLIGPSATATLDGVLYFGGEQAAGNFELWMSDGTPAGTAPWRLAGQSLAVEDLAAFQDRLILVIRDLRGRELWESDGSQGGTSLLGKLPDGSIGAPRLVPTTTRLFYRGEGLTTGIELWALRPN